MEADILSILSSGQLARLIPTVADSKKEERATSCLLACFMAVPDFTKEVLSELGAPTGKKNQNRVLYRSNIQKRRKRNQDQTRRISYYSIRG